MSLRKLPTLDAQRRAWLKLGLAAALQPLGRAGAQTPSSAQLQRLPKLALVIGNGAYVGPALKNPPNDARAIADTLKGLGFDVVSRIDANRESMRAAIDTHVQLLARRKGVGLFYFAGHGVQLAWKNYLLPVDARVAGIADVQAQAIELNAVMSGLARAANPMNIVLLDACRDNPFGGSARPEQKGLSQMDAPVGSILGYATAPGNTASDGEGDNGLYTGQLLREMKVQGARIEDVFKRVRLAVRRQSNGAQIPWESTSLEEDYYFVPPPTLAPRSDSDKGHEFETELKAWESIERARSSAPFEDYLKRFPSGQFAEIAQLELDRALAREGEKPVQIAPEAGNPYTAGSLRADTAYKIGDSFTYKAYDRDSGALKRTFTNTVTEITDREVIFNNGRSATDLLGNVTRYADGRKATRNQSSPLEFAVGRTWVTRFVSTSADGFQFNTEILFRVVGKEKVTVPAGTFDCFRVEGKGKSFAMMGPNNLDVINNFWVAPQSCRTSIKREVMRKLYRRSGIEMRENDRYELQSFRQS